jgi:hypothetical protein
MGFSDSLLGGCINSWQLALLFSISNSYIPFEPDLYKKLAVGTIRHGINALSLFAKNFVKKLIRIGFGNGEKNGTAGRRITSRRKKDGCPKPPEISHYIIRLTGGITLHATFLVPVFLSRERPGTDVA